MAPTGTIPNVEIFAPGTWNGDTFTVADLQSMVDAFAKQDFKPAVKIGHVEVPGTPAYGYVDHLRMQGDKLVGDLVDVPEDLVRQVREKRFNRVSAEILFNLKRGAQVFRRALKAVALLGAEVPAVAGLKPLAASFAGVEGEVKFFDILINQQRSSEMKTERHYQIERQSAGEALHEKTLELVSNYEMHGTPITYAKAFDIVRRQRDNADLVLAYSFHERYWAGFAA